MTIKCIVLIALAMTSLPAAIVLPISYAMPNGNTGSYNYWDESYSGSGNTTLDGSPLSGGLGDLTDGVIAASNWFVTEAPVGPGPYVGWADFDPLISFQFASPVSFGIVRIHFDDADGNGGVSTPAAVIINGTNFSIADPAGSAPFWASFNLAGLTTNQLDITLDRNNRWVFASEFEFDGEAIPEPSSLLIAGSGVVALAVLRRRNNAR